MIEACKKNGLSTIEQVAFIYDDKVEYCYKISRLYFQPLYAEKKYRLINCP